MWNICQLVKDKRSSPDKNLGVVMYCGFDYDGTYVLDKDGQLNNVGAGNFETIFDIDGNMVGFGCVELFDIGGVYFGVVDVKKIKLSQMVVCVREMEACEKMFKDGLYV